MTEDDVFLQVLDRFETLTVPYMVVGSYASNLYGRPRGSYDADVVAKIPPEKIHAFVKAFEKDYAIEPSSLARDIAAGNMFNLIPLSGLFKVDVIPVRPTAFAEEEFLRRREIQFRDRSIWAASPEDTILSKLLWYRRGGEISGRQIEDARDVYSVQSGTLDEKYLQRWAGTLGIEDLFDRIRMV